MSLSTRVIAAVGAVVVIGAGTVGGSIAYANSEGKPPKREATLVVGTSSVRSAPLCYNNGKPLDQDQIEKCQADGRKAGQDKKLTSSDVRASDRIGVGVDTDTADRGWFAFTDGGQQGQAPIAQEVKGSTFSGSVLASTLLSTTGTTTVTVVEADQKTNDIYGVWYFTLNTKD
ncbi:hypothetical protein AB0D08_09280 [Kitasatospora sp. NPDC048540]|uniref:hypothetical protein n=1 Tax=unclassified Kitasatospora TaxID=2633591 RepID=UPI00068B714C|nr:hypothetical protein [Kitasatospora sp. MBT63]